MKQLLIVVDYQGDFVDGALGFDGAQTLEEGICEQIKAHRQMGADICFTYDTHTEEYENTQEGKRLPIPHCIRGTAGWELYGKVAKLREPGDQVFEKPAFGSLELAGYLREQGYEEILLVGLVSHICVLSNAILAKAALPEARVVVDASLTMSYDPILHEKALDILSGVQIDVINRKML